VHITYGSSIGERLPEIEALADYWQWLEEVYPDSPRLLLGDFNLRPEHQGWEPLLSLGAVPAITTGATTLGLADGRYANLYDNFWKTPGALEVTNRGILRFPELFGIGHERARDVISDHAPVYLALGNASLAPQAFDGDSVGLVESGSWCIDLNQSSIEALTELPHVGPARAAQIVEARPWASAGDLVKVGGLGQGRVQEIKASGLLCE